MAERAMLSDGKAWLGTAIQRLATALGSVGRLRAATAVRGIAKISKGTATPIKAMQGHCMAENEMPGDGTAERCTAMAQIGKALQRQS